MAWATPVKIGGGSSTGTASLTQKNSAAIASGDLLAVAIHTKGTVTAVSDSVNGTYTLTGPAATSGGAKEYLATFKSSAAIAANGATLTITLSTSAEITTVWGDISGGDGTLSHSALSTATSSVGTLTVPVTVDNTGDLVLLAVGNTQAQAFTNLSGVTGQLAATSISGSGICSLCYATSATAGTVNASVQTGGNFDNDSGVAASFALNPPGGGTVTSGVVNMGGGGDINIPSEPLSLVIAPTPTDIGGSGGGILASGMSVIQSGIILMGMANGAGIAAPDIPMGGSGGMSIPDLPMGGSGGLAPINGTAIIRSGLVQLGSGSADGLAAVVGTSIIASGAINVGSNGGGLPVFSGIVFESPTAFTVGNNSGSGLQILGATVTVRSGPTSMGGNGGGLAPVVGMLVINSGPVLMGASVSPAGGLAPMTANTGYAGGHWVSCNVYIWRLNAQGVGYWKLCKVHIMRATGWSNL